MKTRMVITSEMEGVNAQIKILDYIGSYYNDSSSIREVVQHLLDSKVEHTEVYINSQGGNVLEATEIVNELKKLKNLTVKIGALAASAATYIMSHFYTIAGMSTQIMIHKPTMTTSGNKDEIKADLKALENMTADYLKVYAKKTGKTTEEIDALWANGDYWMTAEEALSNKFIDRIEEEEVEVIGGESLLLEAIGAPSIPAIYQQTKKANEMKVIISALKLAENANENEVLAKVKALQIKADAYDTLVEEQKKSLKQRAEALVSQAIIDKKISASQKETYQKLAEMDFESVDALIKGMTAVPKISDGLDKKSTAGASWTMEEYLENDPEALKILQKEDPEKYQALEKAYFKS